ncbi:MAG: glycosyltransferase family 2 protein [Duncaniella sp.]|nr:glycosyltransferase family 2 protein [Duncaniella sp.]
MKVLAVVVTYNRLELLKRTIKCLRETKNLDGIVVVNNDSTDGTQAWLESQEGLTVIHQANVGGAGGFKTGMKYAYDAGADWIWCMDDDVFPRPDCLGKLMSHCDDKEVGIMSPRRIMDGKIFTTEFKDFNLTDTFASTTVMPLRKIEVENVTAISGAAFEGLFIRREVIDKIGYPNDQLFIFYDDTDYCIRTLMAGYKIIYVPEALMDKYKFFTDVTWIQRAASKRWKRFYQIRNGAWFNHHYGKTAGVRNFRSIMTLSGYVGQAFILGLFTKAYRLKDTIGFIKAYNDGRQERLGKIDYL